MAFEKNNNDMKILLLMLIGIPLIASTNIDCSGKSFHCLNSTHFMICVDLGGGVSYTVDDFVIPCPPPTVCKTDNRFECELPLSTTIAPMTTSPVTTATFTKHKETTVEDITVDSILWNTGPEQHLELSSVATEEPTIETIVIPLQPVTTNDVTEIIVNGTDSSILTTVSDEGFTSINLESVTALDTFLTTPDTLLESITIPIDSRYNVTSNISKENMDSENEKGTEKFSEVITTTESVINDTTVINLDFKDTVNETDINNDRKVQSTLEISLIERSAPTTESAMLNDTINLTNYDSYITKHNGTEIISEESTTIKTAIDKTTMINLAFEVNMNETSTENNTNVHSNFTVQQDQNSITRPINVSNASVQTTSGLSLIERSVVRTESAIVYNTSDLTNYDTFLAQNTMVTSTDIQPSLKIVQSNVTGIEIANENVTVPNFITTKSIITANESVKRESISKSVADIDSVPTQESTTNILILPINATTETADTITNNFDKNQTEIEKLPNTLIKNVTDKLLLIKITEAPFITEVLKNTSLETSTLNNINIENQYSVNKNTTSSVPGSDQSIIEVTDLQSTLSNNKQNDTTVDIGTTLSTASMPTSVPKEKNKTENYYAIISTTFTYNSTDANIYNTGLKEDEPYNIKINIVKPSLYTTPNYPQDESSTSNLNDHYQNIRTDYTLATESIRNNTNNVFLTESELTSKTENSDTDKSFFGKDVTTSSVLDVTETSDNENLLDGQAMNTSTWNVEKQVENEFITTENTMSSFEPVLIQTSSDVFISSTLETEQENNATTTDDSHAIANTLLNGSNTVTSETNILPKDILEKTTKNIMPRNSSTEKQEQVATPSIDTLSTESNLSGEEKQTTQVTEITSQNAYNDITNSSLINRTTDSLSNHSSTTMLNSAVNDIKSVVNAETNYVTNTTEYDDLSLLPRDAAKQGTSESSIEKYNDTNMLQNNYNESERKPDESYTKNILQNSEDQTTSLPSTGQDIDISTQNSSAPIAEQSNNIGTIQNGEVKFITSNPNAVSISRNEEQITSPPPSPTSVELSFIMNTLLNREEEQMTAMTPSLEQSTNMNIPFDIVQQITFPIPGQSNNMNTLFKGEVTQSSLAHNYVNIIKSDEILITSTLTTEKGNDINNIQKDGPESITRAPNVEQSNIITTIQKQQEGAFEQIMSVPDTEQANIINTIQTSEQEQVISAPSTEQSDTVIKSTDYGFEQSMPVTDTEKSSTVTMHNAVVKQITAPSYVLNTLSNNGVEQATAILIVEQNDTIRKLQNMGVEQIMVLSSTEHNILMSDAETIQYSGVNQIESVLGVEQSNYTTTKQNSTMKGTGVEFDKEINNTNTTKSYVLPSYSESNTVTNLLQNTEYRVNDNSNSQLHVSTVNAYKNDDVTKSSRLLTSSSQSTGSTVVLVSKGETLGKSSNSRQTNTSQQSTGSRETEISYNGSLDFLKQSDITNTIQNNGLEYTGSLSILAQSSAINIVPVSGEQAGLQTELEKATVPIVMQASGGENEYVSERITNTKGTAEDNLNKYKISLTTLPDKYTSTATVSTEYIKVNGPVTLSASTETIAPKLTLNKDENGYNNQKLTFSIGKTASDTVESDSNSAQHYVGSKTSNFIENHTESHTEVNKVFSKSGLITEKLFNQNTSNNVVAKTTTVSTLTKLSNKSQQNPHVNVAVAKEDKISHDGKIAQSISESLPVPVTSTPIKKVNIDLTVTSTSSYIEEYIPTKQIPLVVEVTTKMTATTTENSRTLFTAKKSITSTANNHESISTDKLFDCRTHSTGKFADNNDCSKFYICSGSAQLIIGKCPINTVFSEIRKQCTRNISHCIRNNEFKCTTTGRFPDYLKPNVYYICVKKQNTFLRYKLQCQKGYLLNKLTTTCYKNLIPAVANQSISSDSFQNTTEKISKEMESVKNNKKRQKPKEFECDDEGKFPNPYNCRGYYICKLKNKSEATFYRKYKKCDEDEVFHREKKRCVDASSYECRYCESLSLNVYYVRLTRGHRFSIYKLECQEGYELNATEVRCNKKSEASNSNKIMQKISQEPDKSNSRRTNKKRFQCQEEGKFEDPNNCRKYYQCQEKNNSERSEQRFRRKHKKCFKNEVFNPETQLCIYSRNMSCLYY